MTVLPAEGVVREGGHVGRHGGQRGQRGEVVDGEVALVGEVGGGGVVVVRGRGAAQLAVQIVQLVEVVMASLAAKLVILYSVLIKFLGFLLYYSPVTRQHALCVHLDPRGGARGRGSQEVGHRH